jgi:hypothetical protein
MARKAGIMFATLVNLSTRLISTPDADVDSTEHERGDVPGWVLITLMTAGLVVLIWGLAGPALSRLFNEAIARVSGL